TGERKARDHRFASRQEKKRRDGKNRAKRKEREGRAGRRPGGAAELLGIDAELLAYEGIQRDVLLAEQPAGESASLPFTQSLGLVDEGQLFHFLFRRLLELRCFCRDLPFVQL